MPQTGKETGVNPAKRVTANALFVAFTANDAENIQCIDCHGCSRWWHVTCLDLTEIPDDFFCSGQ